MILFLPVILLILQCQFSRFNILLSLGFAIKNSDSSSSGVHPSAPSIFPKTHCKPIEDPLKTNPPIVTKYIRIVDKYPLRFPTFLFSDFRLSRLRDLPSSNFRLSRLGGIFWLPLKYHSIIPFFQPSCSLTDYFRFGQQCA